MSVLPVYYQTSSISPEIRDVNRGTSLIIDVFTERQKHSTHQSDARRDCHDNAL